LLVSFKCHFLAGGLPTAPTRVIQLIYNNLIAARLSTPWNENCSHIWEIFTLEGQRSPNAEVMCSSQRARDIYPSMCPCIRYFDIWSCIIFWSNPQPM